MNKNLKKKFLKVKTILEQRSIQEIKSILKPKKTRAISKLKAYAKMISLLATTKIKKKSKSDIDYDVLETLQFKVEALQEKVRDLTNDCNFKENEIMKIKKMKRSRESSKKRGSLSQAFNKKTFKSNRKGITKLKFGKKSNFSKNTKFVERVIQDAKNREGKKSRCLTLNYLLKHITQIYQEMIKLDRDIIINIDFKQFIYDHFVQTLGTHKNTEIKFKQFVSTILKNQNILRVAVFSRFLGLVEFSNYSGSDLIVYIEGVKKMVDLRFIGFNIPSKETDKSILFPFNRCMEYFRISIERAYSDKPELQLMKEKLSNLIRQDPTNMNKNNGVADFDAFMMYMIEFYRTMVDKTQGFVKSAFDSADFNSSNKLSINEFMILYKYLEPNSYSEADIFKRFLDWADCKEDDEQKEAMSLDRFSEICYSEGIFSLQSQYSFLGVESKEEVLRQAKELQSNWGEVRQNYSELIDLADSSLDKKYWNRVILHLNMSMQSDSVVEKTGLSILILEKIMKEEMGGHQTTFGIEDITSSEDDEDDGYSESGSDIKDMDSNA